MYAVIETGGKQYKVAEGDKLVVEKLEGEIGSKMTLSEVLFIGGGAALKVGTPFLNGAKVETEILEQGREDKIIVFKKKKRKGYRKKQGHRQAYTKVVINKINA